MNYINRYKKIIIHGEIKAESSAVYNPIRKRLFGDNAFSDDTIRVESVFIGLHNGKRLLCDIIKLESFDVFNFFDSLPSSFREKR